MGRCGKSRGSKCRKPPSRSQYCCKPKKKRRSRRSRSRRGRGKKSCRPGKITRNPFLNFLRVFRKKNCGWSAVKVAVEGAKCWCKMSDQQRQKYYKEACKAPPMKRRRGRRGRSRSRKRSRSRRRRSRRRGTRCP